jgi:hypothetical protein
MSYFESYNSILIENEMLKKMIDIEYVNESNKNFVKIIKKACNYKK